MRRWFRPAAVLPFLVALTVGVAVLVLPPRWGPASAATPSPRSVPDGDQEIVWLNTATNAGGWERFVAAVRRLAARPEPLLHVVADERAFPSETASVPELAVVAPTARGRLWFRWYKITGDINTAAWIRALAGRRPPPLAVIGGGSTDRARDLGVALGQLDLPVASRPLMLITTATSERVDCREGPRDLMDLYPGRSFRFCFTNRQMAESVTDFVWQQEALRPNEAPVYGARWEDDSYSMDLYDRFHELLGPERLGGPALRASAEATAGDWASLTARLAAGNPLPALPLEGFSLPATTFWSASIPFSVGTFNRPNRWETQAAANLVDVLAQHPAQRRALLVLPANPQPAQRFLRAVARTSPADAARFTVATGDALDFNTVYRDRNLKWPVQDLPFDLVLFCHRDPVEPGAFAPAQPGHDAPPSPTGPTSTGTQDLVLYRDLVETLVGAAYQEGALTHSADQLAGALRRASLPDGRPRFDARGDQPSGVGEYVVCLLPVRDGDRVAPLARLQVWTRSGAAHWERVLIAGWPELQVSYAPGLPSPGGAP